MDATTPRLAATLQRSGHEHGRGKEAIAVARQPAPVPESITLSRLAFLSACGTFLLIGALAAAYGPLLGQLIRRFGVGLPTAGVVLSSNFAGRCWAWPSRWP